MADPGADIEMQDAKSPMIITEMTPQLVVPPTMAMKAVHFYEQTFGAKMIRYNKIPRPNARKELFVCAELKLGSNTFVIKDHDHRVTVDEPPPPAKVCLRLECSDPRDLMANAEDKGCEIVKWVAKDPCRPGVIVGKMKDPFGLFWELSSSARGVSDGGFMDKVSMSVLVTDQKLKRRWNSGHYFESFPGTPRVGSCETKLSPEDAFRHCRDNQDSNFNPVVLDLEVPESSIDMTESTGELITEKFRSELDFQGTIVGCADRFIPGFHRAGGDFMSSKPLDYSKVSSILVKTLGMEKKQELRRKKEEEAWRKVLEEELRRRDNEEKVAERLKMMKQMKVLKIKRMEAMEKNWMRQSR